MITRILFPAVLPNMLTGVRVSVGTAWLVIVAALMLTGGVGIGFWVWVWVWVWVWDEWNTSMSITSSSQSSSSASSACCWSRH